MASLEEIESEQRRLEILAILEQDTDYTLNEDILNRCLRSCGLDTSTAKLHADLLHLKAHGCVTVDFLGDLYVATATTLGIDVAKARERVPGVARPKPGSRHG